MAMMDITVPVVSAAEYQAMAGSGESVAVARSLLLQNPELPVQGLAVPPDENHPAVAPDSTAGGHETGQAVEEFPDQ